MTRKPLLFLQDILNAIERIETYTCNGKEEFLNSPSLQDATLFRLQTIGEAVNQLPNELKEKHSEIPFKSLTNCLKSLYLKGYKSSRERREPPNRKNNPKFTHPIKGLGR